MMKYTLGYNNVAINADYSGGEWRNNLDTFMLKNNLLTATCKTLDLSELVLDITLNAVFEISVLGVCNHNISVNGTYQWVGYSNSSRTNILYDTGVISCYEYNENIKYKTLCDRIDPTITPYWTLIINDNNSDGFIKIGKLFIGKDLTNNCNMDYGLTHTISTDNSVKNTSDFGVDIISSSINQRGAIFSHTLTDYNYGDDYFRMQLGAGISEDILYEFNPENKNGGLYTFIARNKTINPLSYPSFNINDLSLAIEEQL